MDDTDAKKGAHTQFKDGLRTELHKKTVSTIKGRSGPSWDERMDKAMKGFQKQQKAMETEQLKTLCDAVERGRSRPTSAPVRSLSETPNQRGMLRQRQKDMKRLEDDYKAQVEYLKDKMQKREPLYRLSEVNAAFAMQRRRMIEKKQEMTQDEHERWEHLRSVEERAASRPLLIEDVGYKKPKGIAVPAASPDVDEHTSKHGSKATEMFGREPYESDVRIKDAVSQKWFQKSEWADKVSQIRYRADNRQKLHEIPYPNKGDRHTLSRARMQHALVAQIRPVSAGLLR